MVDTKNASFRNIFILQALTSEIKMYPESMNLFYRQSAQWIPRSRLKARPGMTPLT
jgi:hypothetical protein